MGKASNGMGGLHQDDDGLPRHVSFNLAAHEIDDELTMHVNMNL